MRRSRIAAYVSAAFLAAACALGGAQAASASNDLAAGGYVALGDSYSSGVGSGSYTSESGDCKRSTLAYPQLWASANSPSSFDFEACSGARTGDVLANQLGGLGADTGLVSISIGGNDAGFSDVMTTCVLSSDSGCLDRIDEAVSYVDNTLPGALDQVYDAISAGAPSAHVVVLGYPHFYKLDGDCVVGLSEAKRAAINSASDEMNSVTKARAAAHGFTFADVTGNFSGHEICSGDEWLHSLDWGDISDSYHPTAEGQSGGYLPALNGAV
ncbi:SGNH/GDSL hydrolase family protein [Streptomyces sp. NPDC050560]|uniref:SGNH/GDSL hydrolase family protein n=1 Tax=Streptomyces sp. NPDC050560 TaxID=3365630 RepID=UPI0037AB0C8D